MGLLQSIFAAKPAFGTPPFNGDDFQQTGGVSPPSKGLGGFLERMLNPSNAIGQFGQALVAGSGGPLGDAMGYMLKASQARAQQKQKGPHFEHIGDSYGIVDDNTGQFTPTYTAPQKETGYRADLRAAGIDPDGAEGQNLFQTYVRNRADPITSIPLPGGSAYIGPRSGLSSIMGGGVASPSTPTEPPPANLPPAGGAPGRLSPRGLRNNNPLNLTLSPFTRSQAGFTGTDSGGRYATFDSPEHGLAAATSLLGSYARRGFDTPAEIINRWAPSSENGASTGNYVNSVSGRLGIGPNDVVPQNRYGDLVSAMSDFENGTRGSVRVAQGTIKVTSKDQYDQLPSGTAFIAPDGTRRVKP